MLLSFVSLWNEALNERDCVSPDLVAIMDGIKK